MPERPLRIFVVGCPRSGTTLVQSLLAAHPTLTGFTESHVYDKAFDRRGRVNATAWRRRIEAFARENGLDAGGCEPARFIELLDHAALDRRAGGWVEKTPDHVFRIGVIRRFAPDAKFIHVLRGAGGALPSLHAASRTAGWNNPKPWWECAAHWYLALRASERWLADAHHAAVSYEKLTADPRAETARLLEFLGLAWDDAVLSGYAQQAAALTSEGEHWKKNAAGPIQPRRATDAVALPLSCRLATALARRLPRVAGHLAG